jgi:hypothetical protein
MWMCTLKTDSLPPDSTYKNKHKSNESNTSPCVLELMAIHSDGNLGSGPRQIWVQSNTTDY